MSAKIKEFGSINSFHETNKFLSNDGTEGDFKNYIISISGFGDLICFGFKKYLLLASMDSSYNSNASSNGINFSIFSQEDICVGSEVITCLLVLPISSLKQSSQGLPDWTCICVGLSNGYVKFFNQFGQMIFSQRFHLSSVESICLRGSPCHQQPDVFNEDLIIVCDTCCYQIDGVYLYESLNTFKKQLIRFQAGFIDDQWDSFELRSKKWLLEPHESISGMVFGYETGETAIDNIFNNVVSKGPFLGISEETSKHINCVVVGKGPFVSFYKLPLESDSLDMGDLAHAVFSKVKGALTTSISSWMGSFSSSAQPKRPVQRKPDAPLSELPSRLQSRNMIDEPCRQASMVVGCPHHNKQSRLAAITDDFGRIFLLDIDDGIMLRMWKGYRDAQISISTTCDGSSTERSVNYLVIYAPRRSLIEVWTLPFGDKVASFDVRDRCGRLLHVPHASLGFSRTQIFNQKVKNAYSTFFLDSNGKISVLEVPFHLSLSSSSNERSQDHLVLKHFKSVTKSDSTRTDVAMIRSEFSSSIRLLKLSCSVDLLMHNVLYLTHLPPNVILSFIDELLDLLSADGLACTLPEGDSKRLKKTWAGVKALIEFFFRLTSSVPAQRADSDAQNLGDLLNLESADCDRIMNLSKHYANFNQMRAVPQINDATYLLFVNNFTILPNSSEDNGEGFQLSKNVQEKDVLKIGTVLFSQYVQQEHPAENIVDMLIIQMKVDRSSCFRLCLSYLVNESAAVLMNNMHKVKYLVMTILSSLDADNNDQIGQYRLIRSSLQLSQEMVERSSNIMTSLLIAMTIRVVILLFLQDNDLEKEEMRNGVTEYLSSWNDICQRLEDLTIFDCFLKCRPLPDCKKVNVSFDRELVLGHVLENGKGIFSERFAKWALKWSLKYHHINELYKSLAASGRGTIDNDPWEERCVLSDEVKDIFAILYKQLPHSLEYDSVLINVAWEYTRLWSTSIQRIEYLESACELLENIGPAGGLVIQGIGSMIWDMHLVVGLVTLFPIDNASSQQYSSQLACDVTVKVIRFLKMLSKALDNTDVIPTFSTEHVWCGDKSRSSLIDMAVNKDLIQGPALELHIEMLYALQLVSMLNVPKFSCYTLFSKETRSHIFKSLTLSTVGDSLSNDSVECKPYRMMFLEKCIKSCVYKFTDATDNSNLCHNTNVIVKMVAEKWMIDLDDVLQCWIQNYYLAGLDSQGAMYVDKVLNLHLLAVNLLRIVGARIKKEYLLPESKYYRECSKYVTPPLKRWLQSIDDRTVADTAVTGLDRSDILLSQLLEWIPENAGDFEAATCLQSLLLNIQRTKKYIE